MNYMPVGPCLNGFRPSPPTSPLTWANNSTISAPAQPNRPRTITTASTTFTSSRPSARASYSDEPVALSLVPFFDLNPSVSAAAIHARFTSTFPNTFHQHQIPFTTFRKPSGQSSVHSTTEHVNFTLNVLCMKI